MGALANGCAVTLIVDQLGKLRGEVLVERYGPAMHQCRRKNAPSNRT